MSRFSRLVILSPIFLVSAWGGPIATTQYNFSGVCFPGDCTGNGTGVLTVLGTYVPGTQIGASFVSLTYTSNLIPSFTILSSDPNLIVSSSNPNSIIPASLPGPANVFISSGSGLSTKSFQSTTVVGSPNWFVCTGNTCAADFGTNGTWSGALAGVPEPGTMVLTGLGLGFAGWFGLKKRRF